MINQKVMQIISKEHQRLDMIANAWIKGMVSEANNAMYQLFSDYGYRSDCEDTEELFNYINELISNTMAADPEIWREVISHPEYEVTIDGSVRRKDTKKPLKVYPKDRVKLTKDGKIVTVRIADLVYENWYKNKDNNKDKEMEYIDMSSDLDYPKMTGELDWSGITETNLVEDEKK